MNCLNCSQLLTSADQPCPYCGAARRRPDMGALAVALIPLLVVGIVVQGANRGSAVGAASAQGAVTDLATAVGKQDVLGALASIAPEESAAATNIIKAVIGKAQQTKAVSAAEGQSAVDNFNQNSGHKLSGVYIMTVKRNGRWFVSPFYTVAEYLREAGGLPAANYDSTTQGQLNGGASSPERVVRSLFAGSLSDPTKSLSALPPDSLRVVYDYMGDIKGTVDNLSRLAGTRVDNFGTGCGPSDGTGGPLVFGSPSGSSLTSLGSGYTPCPPASAPPTTLNYTAKITLKVTGTCYSVTSDTTPGTIQAAGHGWHGCLAQAAPGLKLDSFFIMTVKERGAWYVDPLGTVAAYLRSSFSRRRPPTSSACSASRMTTTSSSRPLRKPVPSRRCWATADPRPVGFGATRSVVWQSRTTANATRTIPAETRFGPPRKLAGCRSPIG